MPKKVTIRKSAPPVMTVFRAPADQPLVYLLVANKLLPYPKGRSKIVYIGSSKNGASRIAQSLAHKGREALKGLFGVRQVDVYILTYRPPTGAVQPELWKVLERACLIKFWQLHGRVPQQNKAGNNLQPTDEFTYFVEARVEEYLLRFEKK